MNLNEKELGENFSENQSNQSKRTGYMVEASKQRRARPDLFRIHADNQDRSFLCIFWTTFFVFIITVAIISTSGTFGLSIVPSAILTIENQNQLQGTVLENCQNPNTVDSNKVLQCGQFSEANPSVGLLSRNIESENQFIAVFLILRPSDLSQEIVIEQNATYEVADFKENVSEGNIEFVEGGQHANQTSQLKFDSKSSDYKTGIDGTTRIGYKKFLGFLSDLTSSNIYLNVKFEGQYSDFSQVSELELEGLTVNSKFTDFTIGIRYMFFAIAILTAFVFIRGLKQSNQKPIIEQRLIAILSILLICFNDPFYPITVLKPNGFSSFLSVLFVISYISFLIFVWIVFLERILYEEGERKTELITKPKIIYTIVLFSLLMSLYLSYAFHQWSDHPILPEYDLETGRFLVLQIITFLWAAGGMAYLFGISIQICCKPGDRLWRNEMFLTYSALFQVAQFIFFTIDNSFGPFKYNGTNFIFLYAFVNLYTWYLQYMYTESGESAEAWDEKQNEVNSQQRQSVGTIEFNDLNIDLDSDYDLRNQSQKNVGADQKVSKSYQEGYNGFERDSDEENQYHVKAEGPNKERDSFSSESWQQESGNKLQSEEGLFAEKKAQAKEVDFFKEQESSNQSQNKSKKDSDPKKQQEKQDLFQLQ